MACRESLALGAYLLGALEPAERSAVARHVMRCAECRAKMVELTPVVGLLRQVPFEEQRQPTRAVPAAVREPVGMARATSRVARAGVRRRALLVGALAAAAVGVGVGILGAQGGRPTPAPSVVTVSATDPATHVTASAALAPAATGTAIRLRVSGLPPVVCGLVVRARDGHTETAASWTSGYATAISVPGSSSLGVRDIARMDVVTSSGRLLVELRPR
jgi:anti-sigma factor RsiW